MTAPALLLDLQPLQDGTDARRGLGRVAAELAAALHERPGAVAGLLLNPALPAAALAAPLDGSPLLGWATLATVRRAAAAGPVAYHLLAPFAAGVASGLELVDAALRPSVPLVVHLHDLIPLTDPARYLPAPAALAAYGARLRRIAAADLVLAVSRHTREAAVAAGVDPARCRVVGNGAAARFRPAADPGAARAALERRLPALRGQGVVLCVAGDDERKNVAGLMAAWGLLPRALRGARRLVVACRVREEAAAAWRARARAAGVGDEEVVVTGEVDDDVLVLLYQCAELLVAPSFAEGFGLPVAEAVACGCPAITSAAGALPEVLDDPASVFDPADPGAIAAAIARALEDPGHRERLVEAGRRALPELRWPAVAERVLAAVAAMEPREPPRPLLARRRLALVGPMPPTLSGIAAVNARLAGALAERADVDVLVPSGSEPAPAADPQGVRRHHVGDLGSTLHPGAYDIVVHAFGNSEHHLETYELALRWPGLLHLHDVRLGGFHREYAHNRHGDDPAGFLRGELRRLHGARCPWDLPDPESRELQLAAGLGLTPRLVRAARAVLVNSALAARLLALDQGADGPLPPVCVGFLPAWAASGPASPGPDTAPRLVGSFGLVDPVKSPERVIDAVALLGDREVACVFVGPVDATYRARLEERARDRGVGDRIRFTGPVADEVYRDWLRRVSVGVQLRTITNGESSGSVADLISAAVPVVTDAVDADGLPAGAVTALPWGAEPAAVAAALTALLDSPDRREMAAAAAASVAATRTYAALADLVLEIVDDLDPLPRALW